MKAPFVRFLFPAAPVKARVAEIKVLAVEMILYDTECFTEALEVNDLSLAQKFDRLDDVGVIDQLQNVVVGGTGLLLC